MSVEFWLDYSKVIYSETFTNHVNVSTKLEKYVFCLQKWFNLSDFINYKMVTQILADGPNRILNDAS